MAAEGVCQEVLDVSTGGIRRERAMISQKVVNNFFELVAGVGDILPPGEDV